MTHTLTLILFAEKSLTVIKTPQSILRCDHLAWTCLTCPPKWKVLADLIYDHCNCNHWGKVSSNYRLLSSYNSKWQKVSLKIITVNWYILVFNNTMGVNKIESTWPHHSSISLTGNTSMSTCSSKLSSYLSGVHQHKMLVFNCSVSFVNSDTWSNMWTICNIEQSTLCQIQTLYIMFTQWFHHKMCVISSVYQLQTEIKSKGERVHLGKGCNERAYPHT